MCCVSVHQKVVPPRFAFCESKMLICSATHLGLQADLAKNKDRPLSLSLKDFVYSRVFG